MLVQKTTKNPIKPAGYGFLERFLLVKCTVGWSVHLMWFWICWFFERWKTHTKWKVKPRSHQDIYLVWTLQHMLAELSQTHTSPHSGFNTHDSLQKAIDKPQLWRIWQIHHTKNIAATAGRHQQCSWLTLVWHCCPVSPTAVPGTWTAVAECRWCAWRHPQCCLHPVHGVSPKPT